MIQLFSTSWNFLCLRRKSPDEDCYAMCRKKVPRNGLLPVKGWKPVIFVANPERAPFDCNQVYVRPDDPSGHGKSWRELLWEYNAQEKGNALSFYQAYKVYINPIYERLVNKLGTDQIYILSAGWGLIKSDFLTPKYDITFSLSAKPYKRWKKRDQYEDFCMMPDDPNEDVVFFGGRDYISLFCSLMENIKCRKTVFYNSAIRPELPAGFTPKCYPTRTKTNWHYECANAFLDGKVSIE